MTEINGLPEMTGAEATDDDLLVIYDVSAGTQNSKRIKKSAVLKDVAKQGGDHNFGTVEINSLTATISSFTFQSGAAIDDVILTTQALVVPSIDTGLAATITTTVSNVAVGDYLNWTMTDELPDGLLCEAWISAADTVSVKFFNATTGTISGATRSIKLTIFCAV